MNNNEKIKEAERLIAEANKLIAEVKNSNDDENILADYINAHTELDRLYYIDPNSNVDYILTIPDLPFDATVTNPYKYYPTKELAEQAKAMKDFNDKMLAFKYCYDADYEPDWNDVFRSKFYVYYDAMSNRYKPQYARRFQWKCTVYFSTYAIAQKCAEWLNSLKEE